MTMGCCSSKMERVPEYDPLPRAVAPPSPRSHNRHGQKPSRPATSACRAPSPKTLPRRPRLEVLTCGNMGTTDEIGLAMATNTECLDEDSPTWPRLSPVSASLAAWRYPSGSESYEERNKRENELVRSIDNGYCPHQGKPGKCEPLGPTLNECVWSADKIAHMTSGEVMIEARRRVRKWYTARYEAIRAELDADKHTSPEKADYRARRQQEAAELKKKIDAGLKREKDEAMRRVMPVLARRWME